MPRHEGGVLLRGEVPLENYRCLLMRAPATGSHFALDFVCGQKVVPVNVKGQVMVNHFGPVLAGQGIAQLLHLHAREYLADGRLVQVLPEWADETWPLYAVYHFARNISAEIRDFVDYIVTLTRETSNGAHGVVVPKSSVSVEDAVG